MSDWDDLHGVTPPRIAPEDAERLLDGMSVTNANHGLGEIDAVLSALRAPAEATELAGLHSALVAFGAAVVTANDPSTTRTRPMIRKLLTGKAIATIGVVTLISAGAAAAAGVVPTPFSASRPVVSHSTEHDDADDGTTDSTDETVAADTTPPTTITTTTVVATEPTVIAAAALADDAAESTDSTDGTDDTEGVGPDVNGPAKFGLCTAYAARTKHDDTTTTTATATPVAEPVAADSDLPVPFQALSDAAAAAGQTVAEFCADAVPGGSDEAPGKSGDNPSATAPGKSDDNPSATAPGKSGDNPSATAPGKPSNPGNGHGNDDKAHP